jgi:hypothetical protein
MTTISASSTIGVYLTATPSYVNPIVISRGVVISNARNSGVYSFTGSWTIENNGSIASPSYNGVYLGAGGSVTNTASASITGYDGVNITGGAGLVINKGDIVGSSQNGIGVNLAAGGSVTNESGGAIGGFTGVVLNAGGTVTNAAGASITGQASGVDLSAGGTLTNAGTIIGYSGPAVVFGGSGSNLLVLDPGYKLSGIAVGGARVSVTNTLELASAASAGTLSGLGTEFVNFGSIMFDAGARWTLAGANTIVAGSTLTELSGGALTVTGLLTNDGVITLDPSTITVANMTGTGSVTISSDSTLAVQSALASTNTIVFGGSGAYLHLETPDSAAATVTNFSPGENIDLTGITASSVHFNNGTLSFTGGEFSLSLAGASTIVATQSTDGAAVTAVCFCVDTMIATPSGDRPVQELVAGDLVLTQHGTARPIAWVGTGRVVARRGQRDAATPVIVRKGALADNVPHHDLRVTKGHSFYLDGALIPVEFLVNHRSIMWDDRAQEVEIFHIELETHDVLLANGAPAESYRDDGNRWLFGNANGSWGLSPQVPCAPVRTGGPVVDEVWRRLLERAGPRPLVPTTDDPDLHLLVDGRRVDAAIESDGWHIFRVADPPATVRIVSRAGVPQEMGLSRDPRCLGVALRQIVVARGRQVRTIEAEDALLRDNFHGYEADNDIRWTDGNAGVPADLFEGFAGPLEIALRLGCTTRYPD